jgi:hypothetical protein
MARQRQQQPAKPGSALVLADIPERNRLRELRALLNERRDQIAELDLEIETVRDALAGFEAAYQGRVAAETADLDRIERLVRHYERWVELLQEARPTTVVSKGRKLDARRTRELAEQERRKELPPPAEIATEVVRSPDERLKTAYRALARRFHPDLARTEPERIQFGDLMARINALYRDGDLERLEVMAEQSKGGDVDDEETELAEQLAVLEERLRWFDLVLQNLRDERVALERTPTCELMRNVEQARATGRDLIQEIRQEMRARVDRSYAHVASAARLLESAVDSFNRRNAGGEALTKRQTEALERRFDPFADKRVVRLGLEELRDLHVSPQARELAARLETELAERPAVLRLLLLTYVSELSPFPLSGLEGYDDLELRFTALAGEDEAPPTLERMLVEADAWVEYGVKRASDKMIWSGLRFHDLVAKEAVPVLLKAIPIRREFKKVLSVLGEREKCSGCRRDIFSVPLFRTHGLDDLRALVCPRCGHTLRSYWMPKGKDVQAVLNAAFLDFELVGEWSFQLGRGSFGTQLLPLQVEVMKVGELRQRVFADVFERYEVELEPDHLWLTQAGERVGDDRPLGELESTTFVVELAPEAKLRPDEALEVLRHRVRNRFKA